jgi:mRNA interferase RelE/StbE
MPQRLSSSTNSQDHEGIRSNISGILTKKNFGGLQMKDEAQPKLNEHFNLQDLASLKAGLSEVTKKKMGYTYPVFIVDFLKKYWKLEPYERGGIKINLLPVRAFKLKEARPFWELPRIPRPSLRPLLSREGPMEKEAPAKWYAGLTDQFIKDIQDIDRKLQGRILQAVTKIIKDPTDQRGDTIKPLGSDFKGLWRYRIGDFRLVYLPDPETNQITFISFASRGEVYKT